MDESAHKDLKLLVQRKWDPRVGMGKYQGRFEWVLGIFVIVGIFSSCLTPRIAPAWFSLFTAILVYGSILILSLSWGYTRGITRKRIENRAKKHDGFLCVWCSYPFTGLGDEGHCPECGAGYKKELCQRLFGQAYRKYTPSPQEFGKRESIAWREAIQLRDDPGLVEPSPPPVIEVDHDAPVFSPTKEQQYEINQLVLRRRDPRKGVGPTLGTLKYVFLVLMISMFLIAHYVVIPATQFNDTIILAMMFLYIGPFIGFILCWLIPIRIRSRTNARAHKHSFVLCPWCRHSLSGLPEVGVCSSCGSRFRRWACELLYQNAYRGYRPNKEELRERETKGWTEAVRIRDQES